jgi:peptidoglycan/LPS O-acetylase OafA/YrhL
MTRTEPAPISEGQIGRSHRRADIQGLRAIAVLVVVAFHAELPLPGGFVGVDVFFVISGFVITAMLMRERRVNGRIDLTTFYVRRFRRLTPALALVVSFTVIVSALLMSPLGSQQITATTAIAAMLVFANVAIARNTGGYFDALASTNPLLHTWSLSVEEQFYLIFPVLLIVGWHAGARAGRPRLGVAAAVSAAGFVSFVIAMAPSLGITVPLLPDIVVGFYGPVGRVWEFAAGALLAVLVARMPPPSRAVATASGTAGVAFLAISLFAISESTAFPGPATITPVIGTLLLIYAGQSADNAVSRVVSSGPFVYLGNISYSWYLWHWPLIVFAVLIFPSNAIAAPLAALLSLAPALLSYKFVEQRFRVGRPRGRGRLIVTVAVTLLVPVTLAGALTIAVKEHFWSQRVETMQQSQTLHAGSEAGCMSFDPITEASAPDCTWNAGSPGEPIYLIGDSIAEHYSEAIIGASSELNRPVTIATAANCPAYHLEMTTPGSLGTVDATEEAGCGPYIDGTLSWLDRQPPGLVIMGANDLLWWAPSDVVEPRDMSGAIGDLAALEDVLATNVDEKKRSLIVGMSTTVERLQEAGHSVVIAKAPPSYRFPSPSWLPGQCSVATILADNCKTSATIKDMDRLQGATRDAINQVAAVTGAAILDPRDYFCPDGVCTTSHGDLSLYLDDIHISVPASEDLSSWFTDFVASHD